jgi:hypothetical protein
VTVWSQCQAWCERSRGQLPGRRPSWWAREDVLEFDLDSEPVDGDRGQRLYLERFIHGEVYRARPDVQAVVHSPSVIPFGVSRVPLQPLYHMSAFLGEGVPVFVDAGQDALWGGFRTNREQFSAGAELGGDNSVPRERGWKPAGACEARSPGSSPLGAALIR